LRALAERFTEYDKDSNGTLDKEEFTALLMVRLLNPLRALFCSLSLFRNNDIYVYISFSIITFMISLSHHQHHHRHHYHHRQQLQPQPQRQCQH
jgi:Ca2+-binding EF-hand superfamily protein